MHLIVELPLYTVLAAAMLNHFYFFWRGYRSLGHPPSLMVFVLQLLAALIVLSLGLTALVSVRLVVGDFDFRGISMATRMMMSVPIIVAVLGGFWWRYYANGCEG